MSYSWKIELNSVDISAHVSGFSITASLHNFCREMTIDFADASLIYPSIYFTQISEAPEIEIFTKTGASFVSQGKFFIERPAITSTTQTELMQGVWGRSITALLTEPFAPKVTKFWETQTTFFAVCEEMCDLVGLDFDSAYSDIDDFVIFPYTYEADGLYPADIITELAALAGAIATTDAAGNVCIKQIDYSPSAADVTITDADISEISETPEWPVFANRLRITPTGNMASYNIDIYIPDACLQADAVSRAKIYARITDPDGEPASGLVVDWASNAAYASLDSATSNTQEIVIHNEKQTASNFYTIKVDMPPSEIIGVYAFADTAKKNNFADGGYTIDGNTITLINKLTYCDQTLLVTYRSAGVAVNYIQSGPAAEDVTVTADVEGQRSEDSIYIGNPCQCPMSIRLTAAPTSVQIDGQSKLLVYAEEGGAIRDGRMVYVSIVSPVKRGTLRWTSARLGVVPVKKEKSVTANEVAGVTTCTVDMFPESVTSVYRTTVNSEGETVQTGSNLFSSFDGKTVILNTYLATGLELFVSYDAYGAALNRFTGKKAGDALVRAYLDSSREEGVSDTLTITVQDNTDPEGTPPDGHDPAEDDGGWGGPGGLDDEEDDEYDPNEEDPIEEGGDFNWCVPDGGSSANRFDKGLEHNCSCAEMCQNEFDIYGTTQGYDGGSGKKISQLAVEQCACEEGSPEYWEKYEELKAEALEHCVTQCGCSEELEWDTTNSPTTIVAGSSVTVFVTGGRAPYKWSVSGTGYSLLSEETEIGQNQVTCAGGECGTDYDAFMEITVSDDCGDTVSGELKNISGTWIEIDSCSQNGGYSSNCFDREIDGRYSYIVCSWCCRPSDCGTSTLCCDWSPQAIANCNWCSTIIGEPYTSTPMTIHKYEWSCPL